MSDDEYLLGLREWLPITEPVVFGVDRRPCPPTPEQVAWARRGRLRRFWDWLMRRKPPGGPTLWGWTL